MATNARRMDLRDALCVIRDLRVDQIVISSMGSAREWPKLSRQSLDFHYVPSAMGQAAMLGLGVALAQPARQVIAFSGDGSLLMNLGCLVTIAASGATNLTLIVFENGVYEVTGGQQTAATAAAQHGANADLAAIARASGIHTVLAFDRLADWRADAAQALTTPGPRCIVLRVDPVTDDFSLDSPGPVAERLWHFRAALGVA